MSLAVNFLLFALLVVHTIQYMRARKLWQERAEFAAWEVWKLQTEVDFMRKQFIRLAGQLETMRREKAAVKFNLQEINHN